MSSCLCFNLGFLEVFRYFDFLLSALINNTGLFWRNTYLCFVLLNNFYWMTLWNSFMKWVSAYCEFRTDYSLWHFCMKNQYKYLTLWNVWLLAGDGNVSASTHWKMDLVFHIFFPCECIPLPALFFIFLLLCSLKNPKTKQNKNPTFFME